MTRLYLFLNDLSGSHVSDARGNSRNRKVHLEATAMVLVKMMRTCINAVTLRI